MINGHRICIDGNRMRFPGMSFGYGDSDPFVIANSGDFYVIRIPGTREWYQLGSSEYYPARWMLVRIYVDAKGDARANCVMEERPGRHWHKCMHKLITEMERCIAEER